MKLDGTLKHFVLAFLLALVFYAVFYRSIENRRTRKGPWQVTFTTDQAGNPALLINQPKLAISDVQVTFSHEHIPSATNATTLSFCQPQAVPYNVPFGKCVFMDTTFLPGSVTFDLFHHEVELLPRVLIIDHQEHPWVSRSTITLNPVETKTAWRVP